MALALFLLGCGGGSSGSGGRLSSTAFTSQVNELCKSAFAQVEQEYVPLFEEVSRKKGSRAQFEKTVVDTIAVPAYQKVAEEMDALEGTGQDERGATAVATKLQRQLEVASKQPAKVFASIHYFTPTAEVAKKAGFLGCAVTFGGKQVLG